MPGVFIQDAIKFLYFVHAVKPEPHNEMPRRRRRTTSFGIFSRCNPRPCTWRFCSACIRWDEARKLAGKDPVRHCPICDGFEVIDADVAVIG
jgi:hypothetical protein